MKKVFGLLAFLLFAPLTVAEIKEGVQYQAVSVAQPTGSEDKIEVLELFWYGCPHCYYLEPDLNDWLKNKPDDVSFVRMPAVLGPAWELHARAFYTAELLGVTEKVHTPLFASIHKDKKRYRNKEDIKAFFVERGVSEQDFDQTFSSFAVITKTNRAKQARNMYGITGVPTLVINGKYRTTAQLAGGNRQMFEVVDELIARERAIAADTPAAATQN